MTSISMESKPVPCKTTGDWLCNVWSFRQAGQTARSDGFNLRQEARTIRNEARIRTEYGRVHNDMRLTDRITEVGKWREIIKRAQSCVKAELKNLDAEKAKCEDQLERISSNFGIVGECLGLLDKRLENDIVCDEALRELRNEIACLEAQRNIMVDRCHTGFEERNRLAELACLLNRFIEDEEISMELDVENLTLTRHSSNISYKPDPSEERPGALSNEAWRDHMRCSKLRADNEVASAVKLREAMTVSRVRTDNDIRTQKNLTEFALRKVAYDTQRAKNELEWQKQKLKEEMIKISQEIRNLECSVKVPLDSAQMLAETRLETRKYRPNCEFVHDEPMQGLLEEIDTVKKTRQEVKQKLDDAKATYNCLEDLLVALDRDLEGKIIALTCVIQALDTHKRLGKKCEIPANPSTARNFKLTNYDKEISPCQGPLDTTPNYEREYEPHLQRCGIRQTLTC